MIDIHCHIIPGIDDGPKTIEDSVQMANFAVSEGITTIIATPHHLNGKYENIKKKIIEKINDFNEVLVEEGIPLVILPGQEIRIHGEMVASIEKGDILTINQSNQYVFVELPSNHVPRYTSQLFYDLQLIGLTPILVHPERNSELIETPDILYKLVKNGALTQLTAASILGRFGKKIRKFSIELIEYNLTHFIASDAHNITNRSFHLRDAYETVEKELGSSRRYLLYENADLLVNGSTVYTNPPERIKKKKFLGIF